MRTHATLIVLTLAAPLARAQPPGATPSRPPAPATAPTSAGARASTSPPAEARSRLPAIDLAQVPLRCRATAVRANGSNLRLVMPARISLASCVFHEKVAVLALLDTQESVIALDQAAGPSLAYLDEVIARGEPAFQAIAHHAKGQLYTSMATRMRNTVPPSTDPRPEAVALRDSRLAIVDAMIAPWRDQALDAHRAVVAVVGATPALAHDRSVQPLVRESRALLAEASVAVR